MAAGTSVVGEDGVDVDTGCVEEDSGGGEESSFAVLYVGESWVKADKQKVTVDKTVGLRLFIFFKVGWQKRLARGMYVRSERAGEAASHVRKSSQRFYGINSTSIKMLCGP